MAVDPNWLNLSGMALTALGAAWAAAAVIITDKKAEAVAGTYWNYNPLLKASLKRQSRAAAFGLLLVMAGTLLQAASVLSAM